MADEANTVNRRIGRRRRPGRLVVVNGDSDGDSDRQSSTSTAPYRYDPPPLPSVPSYTPYPDHPYMQSPSYVLKNPNPITTPLRTDISDQSHHAAQSNPSLSPSGSSSPAIESTPPPSTPGQHAPPANMISDGADGTIEKPNGAGASGHDDRAEVSNQNQGLRASVIGGLERIRQHLPSRRLSNHLMHRPPGSPTIPTSAQGPYGSPINHSRDSPKEQRVLVTVTADCDNYAVLDITGVSEAAIVREKIFTKLQISDEEQPHFSIFRTQIGSFAMGPALSDDRLMEICREEGDAIGSLKFYAQHASAPVHRPRAIATIPPVLNYQEPFRSPNRPQQLSPQSNHDSRSSVSEPIHPEGLSAGYEASVSDDFDHNDRHRNMMRTQPLPNPPSQSYGHTPASPMDRRTRRNGSVPRPASPTGQSPGRTLSPIRTGSRPPPVPPLQIGRGSSSSTLNTLNTHSPRSPQFEDSTLTPPTGRSTHGRTTSDTIVERNKAPDTPDKSLTRSGWRLQRSGGDDRGRQQSPKRKGKQNEHDGKRTLEPWVLVPPHKERPSTTESARSPGITRPTVAHHSQSASATIPGLYPNDSSSRYPGPQNTIVPRTNLPNIPQVPRHAPPMPPSGPGHRLTGQAVPPGWLVGHGGASGGQRTQPALTTHRLVNTKSVDSLRAQFNTHPTTLTPGGGGRKPSQLPMTVKPSMNSLRDVSSANTPSGSYAQIENNTTYRRENGGVVSAGMQRMYDTRNALSPTNYMSRPPGYSSAQSPDSVQGTPGQARLPFQASAPAGTSFLNTAPSPNQSQRREDPYPRPQSAADDIGASPVPQRQRTFPHSTPWNEPDYPSDSGDMRSPRMASPQNPGTASARSNTSNSISQAPAYNPRSVPSNLGAYDLSTHPYGSAPDSSTLHAYRGPRALPSPESPRRPSLENRTASVSALNVVTSSRSPLFSPVDDREHETSETLKPDEHIWMSELLNGTGFDTLDSSTLGPSRKPVNQPTPPPPPPPPKTEVSNVYRPESTLAADDEYDYESESETGTLWQKPLAPLKKETPSATKDRPVLSVDTENNKATPTAASSRSSPYNTPPNFPPPPFPPPPPPAQVSGSRRVQNAAGKGNPPKRDSSFVKSSTYTWAFRPPAEDVYERLEEFFPDHDLDKPVIEATSGGSSPTAVEHVPPLPTVTPRERSKKKSIRIVAAEHKKRIDRTSRSDSSSMSSVQRKRSTKLWGSKVEEVTPNQAKHIISAVPESPSGPPNPKPIFKWVRGELIGKGTYGRVYLALNATTGEMIAVKQVEIPQTDSDRDDARQLNVVEALKLESETLKDLDHPNIVQYLGFEQTPDFLSIFLEYVPGGSVAGCLRKHGKFDDQVARSFTGQILAGLEYLHMNGIIHRDLKADNLLVDPSGICKISDFGISKRTEDINVNAGHTGMQGSVFWMAPEVISAGRIGHKSGYNGKVDIWSLGCVVLEMWAGRRPWEDADAIAVIFELAKNQCPPPVPPDVILSPAADDFRRKCFAVKADDRPGASELRKHPYLILQPGWTFNGFK